MRSEPEKKSSGTSSKSEGGSELDVMRRDLNGASDAALVVAIGRFRQEALAEAYRRHAGAVFGLSQRLLSDRSRAEEVVQEVFVRLWNDPSRFDPERGSLRSFLLANAHGRSVDLIRADSSRRKREERDAFRTASGGYDVSLEVWDLALASHVKMAMATLSEDERRAIELAYFGGLTYREVASELDQPEGTVKSRIRTGLKRLRGELSLSGITNGSGVE
jgi:RNA polymerase sigma-70 factor, ECF subfamily